MPRGEKKIRAKDEPTFNSRGIHDTYSSNKLAKTTTSF